MIKGMEMRIPGGVIERMLVGVPMPVGSKVRMPGGVTELEGDGSTPDEV